MRSLTPSKDPVKTKRVSSLTSSKDQVKIKRICSLTPSNDPVKTKRICPLTSLEGLGEDLPHAFLGLLKGLGEEVAVLEGGDAAHLFARQQRLEGLLLRVVREGVLYSKETEKDVIVM